MVETLLLLSIGHLFGLYNPNQIADALPVPKANLYRHLKDFSLHQWKCLLVRLGCSVALAERSGGTANQKVLLHNLISGPQ